MGPSEDSAQDCGGGLFPDACSPVIFEDESIYSWCSRFHRLNSGFNARATSRLLFGHPTEALRHDFPCRLETLHQKTRGNLGRLPDMLRQRTLFGFHAAFLPDDVSHEIQAYLLKGRGSSARSKLGLARAGLGGMSPLKFCAACVEEQLKSSGVAWWRVSHQLPSSFMCEIHGDWLHSHEIESRRGVLQGFYLPCLPSAPHSRAQGMPACRAPLVTLGYWGQFVRAREGLRLDDATLRDGYLLQARARGWLAFDGSVRLQQLRDTFVGYYQEGLALFGRAFLGDIAGANAGFLGPLFRQAPSRRHPLKHLLLMGFLFDSPEEFVEILRQVQSVRSDGGDAAIQSLLQDTANQLALRVAAGESVSRAATSLGIPVAIAARRLVKRGVQLKNARPRIVGTDKEKELCEMLLQGRPRKAIAQSLGLRSAFIKDFLATRPELKAAWETAHFHNQRELHRQQFASVLQQYPGLPIKKIRLMPGNGFQWLYNNDIEWLREVLPAIWRR
jgi:hypothetical protein